jgi:hypothetical protein
MKIVVPKFMYVLVAVFLLTGTISCKQLKELKNLTKCEFRLKNIEILSLDNVDVSKVKSANDLDAVTIARLGASLLTGKMGLSYRTNIESKNPNTQNAAINKFELHILFNNVDLVQTVINQRVEVLPGQTTMIPVMMTSDIGQIVRGENIRKLLGWLFPGSDTPAVFTIKIKPSVMIGPATLSYPGFITLSQDFKSM